MGLGELKHRHQTLFKGAYIMSKKEVTPSATDNEQTLDEQARREFLVKAGRFAVITPPALTVLLATTMNSKAIAKSGSVRPGYGRGDSNKIHTGPPGQSNLFEKRDPTGKKK